MMKTGMLIVIVAAFLSGIITFADEPATYDIRFIRQHLDELAGQRVRIEQVVCFVETGRFSSVITNVEDPEGGAWSGTRIFDQGERLSAMRGDTVTAVGAVSASDSTFMLVTSSETEYPPVVSGTATVPDPIDLTCLTACEGMYLDCLIRFHTIEVTSVPDAYGNIELHDGTAPYWLLLRKQDPVPPLGTLYTSLTGLDEFHMDACKIRPRDENDWTMFPPETPTPGVTLGVEIEMPQSVHPGDSFFLDGILNNPSDSMDNVPVFFILNIASEYWFWPSWRSGETNVDFMSMTVPTGRNVIPVIPGMTWPETGDLAMNNLVFYGAMLDSGFSMILGNYAESHWQFGP